MGCKTGNVDEAPQAKALHRQSKRFEAGKDSVLGGLQRSDVDEASNEGPHISSNVVEGKIPVYNNSSTLCRMQKKKPKP